MLSFSNSSALKTRRLHEGISEINDNVRSMFQHLKRTSNFTSAPPRHSKSTGSVEVVTHKKLYDLLEQDPKYLLRLCQKTQWKCIEKCSKLLSRAFSKSFQHVSSKARNQLPQTDDWGNTPLHVISYHQPPPAVVEALTNAALCAPGSPIELYTMVNIRRETPLIIACKAGACRKVINTLFQNQVVFMNDKQGTSAFHGVLNRYVMIQKVPVFRSRWVDLSDIKKGALATTPFYSENEKQVVSDNYSYVRALGPMDFMSDALLNDKKKTKSPIFPLFWSIIDDLMRAGWKDASIGTDFISHLHGAAFLADVLPVEISDMILRTHADCLHESGPTKPLHLTMTRQISSHPKVRRQHAYVVKRLIAMDPAAASSVMPGTSRSTVCQSIAMGNYWDLKDDLEGPVQTLFRCCPDTLTGQDSKTGLFPFMLAATTSSLEEDDPDSARLQLNTVYNLLRAAPESVRT
jgi:hypothetical protein